MLDISDATLSSYVKKGWLKRYGPPGRQHKFYKLSEVEALIESRNTFIEYQEPLPASFDVAPPEDMSTKVDIDKRAFHGGDAEETWYVVKVGEEIAGYALMVSLDPEKMKKVLQKLERFEVP